METSFRSCWRESNDSPSAEAWSTSESKTGDLPELVEEACFNNVVVGRAVPSAPQCLRRIVGHINREHGVIGQLRCLLRVTGGAFMREGEPALEDAVATWV